MTDMPDPWREAFYALERAARLEFEPSRPARHGLNACVRLVDRVFAYCGKPYAPVRFSRGPGLFASLCLQLWAVFGGWPYQRLLELAITHEVALLAEE